MLGVWNQFTQPMSYTFVPPTSSISNYYISASGNHNIDLTSFPAGVSCSVNFYFCPDQLPSSSIAQLVLTANSGSGIVISYRTLISASSSTNYWIPTFGTIGGGSNTLVRAGYIQRRWMTNNTNAVSNMVKNQNNETTFVQITNIAGTFPNMAYYSGSLGTPIT